jgi:hypothetical protein
MEMADAIDGVRQTASHAKTALKWAFPEEKVKNGFLFVDIVLSIAVSHC